jgi:hypothetical protein
MALRVGELEVEVERCMAGRRMCERRVGDL